MAATPDELDILVTSKNHDLKSSVASRAAPGDWLFALVTLQTMEGFGGAGNYGVSRMNGGFGSRPAFTLAPVEGLGAHLRMDIVTLLDQMGSLAREFPMRPGGIGLVWTVPWDGARVEELLLERLHPFYIEVCRRIRLRPGPEGNLAAVRTSSKAARFRLIYGYFSECSGAADSGDFGNWRGRFFIDVVCISGLSKHWTAVFLRGSASGGSC